MLGPPKAGGQVIAITVPGSRCPSHGKGVCCCTVTKARELVLVASEMFRVEVMTIAVLRPGQPLEATVTTVSKPCA